MLEIKEEIESVKWAADEEIKLKQRKIESLKADIKKMLSNREESLELQRKDLTSTFEALLKQRDQENLMKDKEVKDQFFKLENKFDLIRTENMKLSSENHNKSCKLEFVMGDLSRKEENLRQLQFKLDQINIDHREELESYHSRMNQAISEANSAKDNLLKQAKEFQSKLDQVIVDSYYYLKFDPFFFLN